MTNHQNPSVWTVMLPAARTSAQRSPHADAAPASPLVEKRRRDVIVELARQHHQREGTLEIDDDARVSEGDDNGAYLQCWVWCSFDGTSLDKTVHDAKIEVGLEAAYVLHRMAAGDCFELCVFGDPQVNEHFDFVDDTDNVHINLATVLADIEAAGFATMLRRYQHHRGQAWKLIIAAGHRHAAKRRLAKLGIEKPDPRSLPVAHRQPAAKVESLFALRSTQRHVNP